VQGQITDGKSHRGEGPNSISAPALLRSIYIGHKKALRHLVTNYSYNGRGSWRYSVQ
jgi:hypothetical protein